MAYAEYDYRTRREKYEILRAQLENERSSFLSHWRDLGEYISPRRPRFSVTDVNKGDRRNQKIIDSTATQASRTLQSGMMGGITSPARPWFRLTTPDPDLAEIASVKEWLHTVAQRLSTVFLRSNLYQTLPTIYGDLGDFGTAALMVEEDFDSVVRFYAFPIGSYSIATDHRGKVNVFFREFRMTVRQIVQKFGRQEGQKIDWTNISQHVREMWERGDNRETWVDICHVIMPNEGHRPGSALSKHKPFLSCYYERGSAAGNNRDYMGLEGDKLLSEKGYEFFPVLCPRWKVTGEDAYGTSCPGMDALGDIKQLQLMEKRAAQAIEKMINPPMKAPSSLKGQKASILPGDVTYVDEVTGTDGYSPAHEVTLRLEALEAKAEQVRFRVKQAYYEPLFLMVSNDERSNITAREIDVRQEEKLLVLGPVLEQLNQDLLDPLIDMTFAFMLRQEMIPEAPEELQGVDLKVEYISVMAQAQKLAGIASIERFANFVTTVAAVNPEILDKVDSDQMIDFYGDITSVPPGVIRSDDDVEAMRGGRQKAMAAQQAAETVATGAGAAKTLSETDMESDNALTRLMQRTNAGNPLPTVGAA